MCLIVLSLNPDDGYKLVLTSNRDEFYDRPTESMHWWNASEEILSGIDKNFNGTWMALNKSGKLAAVTNVRELTALSLEEKPFEELSSRGDLVKNFLISKDSSFEYLNKIDFLNYQGFNLILFDGREALICSNRGLEKTLKPREIYVVGNKPIEQSSEKLDSAKKDFEDLLNSEISSKSLFNMMQTPKNKPLEFSEAFTNENHGKEFPYRFIETDVYGTRSTTSITIDNNNKAIVEETSFIKGKMMNPAKKFEIEIS